MFVNGKPQWQTVTAGSRRYVAALTRSLRNHIRLSCGVTRVRRRAHGVEIEAGGVRTAFDGVVLAVHSDQALALLADPSECESRALGAICYRANEAILDTDAGVLPRSPRASCTVHLRRLPANRLCSHHDLRLQRLHAAEQYCDAQRRQRDRAGWSIPCFPSRSPCFGEPATSGHDEFDPVAASGPAGA